VEAVMTSPDEIAEKPIEIPQIVGQHLSSVTFVQDYVQLAFDGS
jgi:hypothetical protein